MPKKLTELVAINTVEQGTCLSLKGDWIVTGLDNLDAWVRKFVSNVPELSSVDASEIKKMDMAGAFLLHRIYQALSEKHPQLAITGLKANFQALFDLVAEEVKEIRSVKFAKRKQPLFYRLGKIAVEKLVFAGDFFEFFGEAFTIFLLIVWHPFRLRWRSFVNEINLAGCQALPIIAVMSFLIGMVLAYQLGVQLLVYGANDYIVDLSGVAMLREFAPLISSVIIAGRTSTSYAALIGTMKVNEELDALQTMGISPIARLVLPRMLSLLVAVPLLVVWADVFGVFGSMVMAKSMMGIGYKSFLVRFKQEVAVKHLFVGLVKTPVFATIIGGIGCFQGFQAGASAQSVGERTTRAAVQSIFLLIFADGMFSILFSWMDI